MKHVVASLAACGFALTASATGQQLLPSIAQSDTMSAHFGYAVANVGDVDGDGTSDLGVGAPGGWETSPGRAFVYSGADGRVLHAWLGTEGRHGFGISIDGVGDVDGDGKSDVLVGAFDWHFNQRADEPGYAVVRSGATGAVLHTLQGAEPSEHYGWRVLGLGDVDGDARPDFAVSSAGHERGSRIRVYSGATGACLYSILGSSVSSSGLGFAIARAGDLDGDGRSDLLAGAPRTAPGGFVGAFSGADGKPLFELRGEARDRALGTCVAGGADFDGDGTPDVVVGAATAGEHAHGRVRVHSGRDRKVLFELAGTADFCVGYQALPLPDRDHDGRPELLITDPGRGIGRIVAPLRPDVRPRKFYAPRGDLDRSFGCALALVPGEGRVESGGLLVGAYWGRDTDAGDPAGRALLLTLDGGFVRTFTAPPREVAAGPGSKPR